MEWVYVESSNLAAVRYNEDSQTMDIRFKNESVYQYFDVPLYTYNELLQAESKGQYFHRYIRSEYRYARL